MAGSVAELALLDQGVGAARRRPPHTRRPCGPEGPTRHGAADARARRHTTCSIEPRELPSGHLRRTSVVLLHHPDAGPDTSSASGCEAVRESAEDGHNQDEEEHTHRSDA